MYVDAWNVTGVGESPTPGFLDPSAIPSGDLLALRECDLADLPEDAQDAVLLAGTLLLAYLDDVRRLPEA